MKVGSPIRPDSLDVVAVRNAMNTNFDTVFNCLRQNASFEENLDGRKLTLTVRHNEPTNIPHRLNYPAQNLLFLAGGTLGMGWIESAASNASIGRFLLPSGVILSASGSGTAFRVTSTFGLRAGSIIEVGSSERTIRDISGNQITVDSSVSWTQFETEYNQVQATIEVFVF